MPVPLNCLWLDRPETLSLARDEVHVWRTQLDRPPKQVEELLSILTDDERSKAFRFYFQKDRNHFIVARGVLRRILALYLDAEPEQLRFCYSYYGKPRLADEFGGGWLQFNVSHSGGRALYAVTRNRELGVDIESIRSDFASEQISEQFFSAQEVCALRALSPDLWDEAFFNCWTRKEAYIKAKGEGLSMPLDLFSVSLAPGEPAALLNTSSDPLEASRWSLRDLAPGAGFKGAVAVEGHDWKLKCWNWTE